MDFQLFARKRQRVASEAKSEAEPSSQAKEEAVDLQTTEQEVEENDDAPASREEPQSSDTAELSFRDLGVGEWLVNTCEKIGLETPTPVQRHCIPPILAGRDVVGCAQTGSGKVSFFIILACGKRDFNFATSFLDCCLCIAHSSKTIG